MSKMKDLAYDIEQLYCEGLSEQAIAEELKIPIEMVITHYMMNLWTVILIPLWHQRALVLMKIMVFVKCEAIKAEPLDKFAYL